MQLQKNFHLIWQVSILVLCTWNVAIAGEPSIQPILRFDLGEHTAMIKSIATDDAERYLVTASEDKTARVWSLADGRLLNTLRIPIGDGNEGKLYALALSPDGQMVALGGWTHVGEAGNSVFLFDRASGRLLRRLAGLANVISHLTFSPNGRALAATLGNNQGLRLFSVSDGRLLAEDRDYSGDSYSAHFSRDGHLVTTSYDGYLRLYSFDGQNLLLLAKKLAPGGRKPFAARFSPDSSRIAVGFNDSFAVNVLDARNLTFLYTPDASDVTGSLINVAWSPQGDFLYAGGGQHKSSSMGACRVTSAAGR